VKKFSSRGKLRGKEEKFALASGEETNNREKVYCLLSAGLLVCRYLVFISVDKH